MSIKSIAAFTLLFFLIAIPLIAQEPSPHILETNQRRLALVIGNNNYEGLASLKNAESDAELVAQTMSEVGLDSVMMYSNLGRGGMEEAFALFFQRMRSFDVGVIYYAGHGMQDEFGDSFLIPTDFPAHEGQNALFDRAYPIERVLRRMRKIESKAFVVFLDACRNNPYSTGKRSASSGLSVPRVPSEGVIVGYSTTAGSVAGDFAESENGLYAESLAEALQTPNLPIETLLKVVGSQTRDASAGSQSPEWWGNISGDLFLHQNAEKYEVSLTEEQDEIIDRIRDTWAWGNEYSPWTGHIRIGTPFPDFNSDIGKLNFIGNSHKNRGLSSSALEADLFRLWLGFIECHRRGGATNVDSLFGTQYDLQIEFKSKYAEQQRFCEVFALESDVEFELFVTYLLLHVNSYRNDRIELISDMVELLQKLGDPMCSIVGNAWLRIIVNKHGEHADNILKYPFTSDDLKFTSVWKESQAWEQGLRPGDSLIEVLNQSDHLYTLLVRSGSSPSEFQVEIEEGSYVVQKDGKGMVLPSDSELLGLFREHSDQLVSQQLDEINWIFDEGTSGVPDLLRILPGQGIYVGFYNMSDIGLRSEYATEVGPQAPGWKTRRAILDNTVARIEAMNAVPEFAQSGLELALYSQLLMDLNSFGVWLNGEKKGDQELNARKIKSSLLNVYSVLEKFLTNWDGYTGIVDMRWQVGLEDYCIAQVIFEWAGTIYHTDKICSYSSNEINLVEGLINSMSNDWHLSGKQVELAYLNFAGSKCWRNLEASPDSTAKWASDVISIWTDSLWLGTNYNVNAMYDSSPFTGFLGGADWSLVSNEIKLEVMESLCKMNATLSCGYARPVYWGLRIGQNMNFSSLTAGEAVKLKRTLFLLLDTFFLCNEPNDENWRSFQAELDEINEKVIFENWKSNNSGWESYFSYRF